MSTIVFTDIAVYYMDFMSNKIRCEYSSINTFYMDMNIGNLIINKDSVDLGDPSNEDDIVFLK